MLKACKYRLYPNKEQQEYFAKCFGCTRFIYNKMLADKIEYYKEMAQEERCSPDLIAFEDGTYNPKINKFLCNECYIKFGMPLGMVKE